MFGLGRNRARRYTADRPKATFADVAGAEVTIVPHGRALGSTEQLPLEDRYN
jgi:ATP-dependent Zn protease